MKKLLYILPIFILLLSCNEDPTQVQTDKRFKTVYAFDRTLETGQVVGRLGDISKNNCASIEGQNMITFPNPTGSGITLQFNTNSDRNYEIFIETALADDGFLDQLNSINYPVSYLFTQHKDYFKRSLFNGDIKAGTNSIQLDLNQIGAGVYYITYEDSEGNNSCFPLVIQRFD